MKVNYKNTFIDLLYFKLYQLPRQPVIIVCAILILIVLIDAFLRVIRRWAYDPAGILITFVFVFIIPLIGIGLLLLLSSLIQYLIKRKRCFSNDLSLTISEDCLTQETALSRSELNWKLIRKVQQNRKQILIFVSSNAAMVIPKSSFVDKNAVEEFYRYTIDSWSKSKQNKNITAPPSA